MLIRRALRILTAACVMWAGVVGLTGGFRFEIGILRVSSRETGRPLLAALIASVIAILEFRRLLVPTPLWLDEETIALNVRDRAFSQLGGPLWLGQSAPFGWLVFERAAILALGTSETDDQRELSRDCTKSEAFGPYGAGSF